MGYLKNTSIYLGLAIFNGALSFLILPLLTKYLNPAEYGSLEIYRSFIALLTGILIVGSNTLIFGNYFKWSKEKINIFIHNSILVSVSLGLLFIISFLLSPDLQELINRNFSIGKLFIVLGIVTALVQSITTLYTAILQIQKRPFLYAIFVGGYSLLYVSISLLLIIRYGFGWEGMAYGILFSSLAFFGVTLFFLYARGIRLILPLRMLKIIVVIGSPLILTHIGGWINEAVDKTMVSSMINVGEAGIYSLGYRFGMVVMLIQVAALRAWAPFFYKNINHSDKKSKVDIVKKSYYLIMGISGIALIVSVISPFIVKTFFNSSYINSIHVITLISFSYVFDGIWKIFGAYLVNLNLTRQYTFILIVSAALNIVANYFFIRNFGIIGAALATFISFFSGAVLTIVIAYHYHPMPWLYFIERKAA